MSTLHDDTTNYPSVPPENTFKPQTYEEWKAAHGWQPVDKPRLEDGQRVKDCAGNLGTIICMSEQGLYDIAFDNGVYDALCYEEHYVIEMEPVGMSPSQLAHEQSERERLSAWQQLSLFEVQS